MLYAPIFNANKQNSVKQFQFKIRLSSIIHNIDNLRLQTKMSNKIDQNSLSQSVLEYSQQFPLSENQNHANNIDLKQQKIYDPKKAEEYQKFTNLMGKRKSEQRIQSFISQNSSYNQNANYLCNQCEYSIQMDEKNNGEVNTMERIKKYQRLSLKKMYDLLPIKQKLLRDYISSKKKNSIILENSQKLNNNRYYSNQEDFVKKKKQFQSQNQFIKMTKPVQVSQNYHESQYQTHKNISKQQSNKIEKPLQQSNKTVRSISQSRFLKSSMKFQEIIIKNNEYFQQMHHSVVNRLLNIIQNNQNSGIARSESNTRLSRANHFQSTNINTHDQKSQSHFSAKQNCKQEKNHKQKVADNRCLEDSNAKNIVINNIYPSQKHGQSNYIENSVLKKQKKINELEAYRTFINSLYSTPSNRHSEAIYSKVCSKETEEKKNIHDQHKSKLEQVTIPIVTPPLSIRQLANDSDNKQNNSFRQIQSSQNKFPQTVRQNHQKQLFETPAQSHEQEVRGVEIVLSERPKNNDSEESKSQKKQISCEKKAPVLLQISIGQSSSFNGLTLAQAFSKKLGGRLPSQRMKSSQKNHNTSTNSYPSKRASEMKNQNKSMSKIKKRQESKRQFQLKNKENLKISNISSINMSNVDLVTPNSSSEPCNDLLQRLIGGSKVKVSKKQMYALTKKNYDKLPEVKQRKEKQRRKQLERQRLEKIKEYQKAIRKSSKDTALKHILT